MIDDIYKCSNCDLRLNQLPLLDSSRVINGVFWVGLSAVKSDNIMPITPLSSTTNTGNLIKLIESSCKSNGGFYKTNIVKCLPLNGCKIRYPSKKEMSICFPHLEYEINTLRPRQVFLLGKSVADFVLNKYGINNLKLDNEFNYSSITLNDIQYIPIHHPSYILVYKRKRLNEYITKIVSLIASSDYD